MGKEKWFLELESIPGEDGGEMTTKYWTSLMVQRLRICLPKQWTWVQFLVREDTGTPIRISAHFSAEILQARRKWQDIFKVMKKKNLQLRILYPATLLFRFDREMKNFTDKQKLRDFSTTRPVLQQMLKELL